MLYSLLEDRKIGFPKRQTPGNRGAQSLWTLKAQDSLAAEETYLEMKNPKDCAFGFFL